MLSKEARNSIGKAWPLFFFIVFRTGQSNKLITSYPEMKKELNESQSTIMKWKDYLIKNKVITSINGKLSMTLSLTAPYDSLVTCEQDDTTELRLSSNPSTKRILDKIAIYGNMSPFNKKWELVRYISKK